MPQDTRSPDPRSDDSHAPDDDADVDGDAGSEEGPDEGEEPRDGLRSGRLGRLRRNRVPRKRLSERLIEIAADASRPRLSIADLLELLPGRAIAALLLLFAAPNVLPAPPGTSSILGMPLVYLSAQMMMGRKPWLPGFIANRSMLRSDFNTMLERAGPLLQRAERLLRPRLSVLVTPGAERIIGGICLLLSVVLLLPIPLGNMLPAFAVCIFALGVLERDGVWILAGLLVTTGALVVAWGVVWALLRTGFYLLVNAF